MGIWKTWQIAQEASELIGNESKSFEEKKWIAVEDDEEFFRQSMVYTDVLEHRRKCDKWGKGFCLDCFGGGLTKFTTDLQQEKSLQVKED